MTKLLFLPHCLKKEQLEILKTIGKQKNYKTYVVGGGSIVKKILKENKDVNEIIGIACKDELKLAENYTKNLKEKGTKIIPINLLKDGCKNTEANINKVLEVLK